jgi:hypothetical protein
MKFFVFLDIIIERGIMRKKGYILIVTTIIIALILSGLLYATSIWLRTHATESTEIAQREIALYAAQYGINEMIYNLNTGTTYINGQSISGTTPSGYSYTATYYTGDTFGGTAYIKGVGTAGSFKRTIYASIVGTSGSTTTSDAFKYCMYTGTGGKDSLSGSDSTYFTNQKYGSNYYYNSSPGTLPIPDWNWYSNPLNYNASPPSGYTSIDLPGSYDGKVLYVPYSGSDPSATLTITISGTFSVSLITNYPNVVIQGSGTWNAASYNNNTYPVILHYPSITTGSLKFDLTGNNSVTLSGFLYTEGNFSIVYSGWSNFTLNGMLMAGSLGSIAPKNGTFKINYTNDYYLNPPPHFSSPSGYYYLPGSYREEY